MTRTPRRFSQAVHFVAALAATVLAGPVAAQAVRNDPRAQTAEDGQWTMPAKDYAATRYITRPAIANERLALNRH